jgi:hypothetical protein
MLKNRLQQLLDPGATLNGVDFVEIGSADQRTLRVHFLNQVALAGQVTEATITGGERVPTVSVPPLQVGDWSVDTEGRPLLTLTVAAPGDFSNYTLTLGGPGATAALDRFHDHVEFSFKALCPSDLDCAGPVPFCPSEGGDLPPIDYLAKDYLSFRKALSDFSALRYPDWKERAEADFGMMFLEALSALADDLSYTQDRIAAEAVLDTATQRRSIVRHARLVDYHPRPVTPARTLLQFDVTGGPIPSGLVVSAQRPNGTFIDFETGDGLVDPKTGQLHRPTYAVDPAWNRGQLRPYWWDDSHRCLRKGTTDMWVEGHGLNFTAGQTLLIDTKAATPADPPLRQTVRLTGSVEEFDPLFPGPGGGPAQVTRIFWRSEDALRHDHDLTRTELAGNLVPASQGRHHIERFAIETAPTNAPETPLAVVRTGPNGAKEGLYLYTLRRAPLAWLAPEDGTEARPLPEIVLEELRRPQRKPWIWRRSLLDAAPFEAAYTVEPVRYAPTIRGPDGFFIQDYDSDDGDTIRFGDGIFGDLPDPGAVFEVQYRAGNGREGNVAADAITWIDPAVTLVVRVTNPFPGSGGNDAEPDERVRRLAPQAFRARQFRAVRPEDYEDEAERLTWVQRAGTVYRWTGSWLTVFTTADPKDSVELPVDRHLELVQLLDRRRLAGYESYVPAPRYMSIDLGVVVCARPDAFRGDVEAAVLDALGARESPTGVKGFFHPGNFTFGQPLERSTLEAAVQDAYGVAGVVSIHYRRRGLVPHYINLPQTVAVGPGQIFQLDNDPSRPERGSLHIRVEGGK